MLNKQIAMHKMRRIQSKKYKIGTYEINEISLSCFDDKRFVLDDGIQKLAYFHKDLKKIDSRRWSYIRRESQKWS